MTKHECPCVNAPSVSITFGSRDPNEACDTIVPLGLVLPSVEELNKFYLSTLNHLADFTPHYYEPYKDNPESLERLKFKINVGYCTIESFTIRITYKGVFDLIPKVTRITAWDTGKEVSRLSCGDYLWGWDGYANLQQVAFIEKDPDYLDEFGDDVLNTKFLKREAIYLHFKYKWANGTKETEVVKQLKYAPIATRGDWLDVSVIRKERFLRLHARVLTPTRLEGAVKYGRCMKTLRKMAQKGIEVYWRRSKNDLGFNDNAPHLYWVDGKVDHLHDLHLRTAQGDWTMHTRAEVLDSRKELWFNTTYLGLGYGRRSQAEAPGRNLSWMEAEDRYPGGAVISWPYSHNDNFFMHTAAHEFGHHIVKDAYDKNYSHGHKGTSTWMGRRHANLPTYGNWLSACDNTLKFVEFGGTLKIEFDLMRYYGDLSHRGLLHCRINNDDARGAIWLTKLRFRLKNVKQ
jgi:hypothetical protein